jgi:hypothetical protein
VITVAELIAVLQKMPQGLPVIIPQGCCYQDKYLSYIGHETDAGIVEELETVEAVVLQ